MQKLIGALLATAALFAALAVPAFANGNTNATLYNRGTSTCVNYHAGHANGNHDDVTVYYGCGVG
jgi:hypothetical protein